MRIGHRSRRSEHPSTAGWQDAFGRGVARLGARFGEGSLAHEIDAARARHGDPVSVLEIGCGFGHVLLDLLRHDPSLDLHGINRRPWPAMQGEASMREFAVDRGLFSRAELRTLRLPRIHFCDAARMPFEDESFDLVVSQVAIHYVRRKDLLLQEVWRVLRPEGRAFLHLDTRRSDAPDFLRLPTPRFVIYAPDRTVVPLADVVAGLSSAGFEIALDLSERDPEGVRLTAHLTMRKSRPEPIPLALDFEKESSFNLRRMLRPRKRANDRRFFFGFRSVYRLRADDRP